MVHPVVIHCRAEGFVLENGRYGGMHAPDVRILLDPTDAERVAEDLTERTGKQHEIQCYRSLIADFAVNRYRSERRRKRDIRKAPITQVPLDRVFVPYRKPDDETDRYATDNYLLDLYQKLRINFLIMKGLYIVGAVYEQNGEINTMEGSEFEDFEEHFRTEDHVLASEDGKLPKIERPKPAPKPKRTPPAPKAGPKKPPAPKNEPKPDVE